FSASGLHGRDVSRRPDLTRLRGLLLQLALELVDLAAYFALDPAHRIAHLPAILLGLALQLRGLVVGEVALDLLHLADGFVLHALGAIVHTSHCLISLWRLPPGRGFGAARHLHRTLMAAGRGHLQRRCNGLVRPLSRAKAAT